MTPRIRRRFPVSWCRGESRREAALWNQARLGVGLPRASHQKCTVAPAATISSRRPLEMEAGSIEREIILEEVWFNAAQSCFSL